jgi:hypothetical protein
MREADRFQECQLCGGYVHVFDLAWDPRSRRLVAAPGARSSALGCTVDQRGPCVRWFGVVGADGACGVALARRGAIDGLVAVSNFRSNHGGRQSIRLGFMAGLVLAPMPVDTRPMAAPLASMIGDPDIPPSIFRF